MEIAAIIGAIATLISAVGGLIWQLRRTAAKKRAYKSDPPTDDNDVN